MSTTLQDILARRFEAEPPEIKTIKQYILKEFDAHVAVSIRDNQLIINVPSAALAGALRMKLYDLGKLCKTSKRLIIHIG